MELRDAISRYCGLRECEECNLRDVWVKACDDSEPNYGDGTCIDINECSDEAIERAFDILVALAPRAKREAVKNDEIGEALDELILKMMESAKTFADTSPDAYVSAIERLMALRR